HVVTGLSPEGVASKLHRGVQPQSSHGSIEQQTHAVFERRDVDETVQARQPRDHLVSLPIAHHPAHVFARYPGHRREVAVAALVTNYDASHAVILADMLAELEQGARQSRLYRQKTGGGHRVVGLSQACGQYLDEVLVDFRMPNRPFLECRAADEA